VNPLYSIIQSLHIAHAQAHARVRYTVLAVILTCALPIAAQILSPPKAVGYVLPDGKVRIVGTPATQGIISKLDLLFEQSHPGVGFRFERADDNGAIDALILEATPFAPIDTIYSGGIAYSDIVKSPPFSIRLAHASLNARAAVSPLAVIVNPANPLAHISVVQAASIFTKPLRAPVYSFWSQLGVKGQLAQQPIQPVGLPWTDHYASEDRAFAEDVFFRKFGGAPPVDTYRMLKTYAEVAAFVAREPMAIGIVALNKVPAGVKVLGLTDGPFARDHTGSAEDIRSGRYPLDRYIYMNLRVQTGKPLDPFVRAYIEIVLSPAGQAAIADEGEGYIPLNLTELAEERNKLEE
jgi:phosphate transport system substrate-binding protein